jgi:hypothetical protein
METTHEYLLEGGQPVLLSWGKANFKILLLDLALDSRLLIASLSEYTTKSTMKNANYFATERSIETDRLLKEQH